MNKNLLNAKKLDKYFFFFAFCGVIITKFLTV